MDLSKVKWVVIILIVVGGGWLFTEGGVNWMYNRATSSTPGEDEGVDARSEAALTRYGGLLLSTFRYEKAKKFYSTALERYPNGKHNYWNMYQLARCEDKLGNFQNEVDLLVRLYEIDADQYDERIPGVNELKLRIEKLVEVNELPNPFDPRAR
jgi:tetratricopeptide (TPR) repeat protein